MPLDARARAIDRVRKLIRLVDDRAATEAERETALQQARRIIKTFNIRKHEV